MKYFFIILMFLFGNIFHSQIINKTDSNRLAQRDTLEVISGKKDSLKIFRPKISDYLFQTEFAPKKIFDTTFTVGSAYRYTQYNNKDNFGRIQFANTGSGFQSLTYEHNPEANLALLPTNKSYNITSIKDVKYYDVKTPTTYFIYHNGMKNGGTLYTNYTQNVGKNFNFAIQYFGLRSQGAYRNSLASSNNTLFSAHYLSPGKHYELFAHYTAQNFNNQEYGGVEDLDNFLSGDSRFRNRQNLVVNLLYSNSRFAYRRYYITQQYAPFNVERFPFKIRYTLYWQDNKYYFGETATEPYYGTNLIDYPYNTKKYSTNLNNTVSLLFDKEKFKFDVGARYQIIKLGVDPQLDATSLFVPGQLVENRIGAVGNLQIRLFDKVGLQSSLEISQGNRFGSFLRTENNLDYEPVKGYQIAARVNFQSAVPSFNYLLNASPYKQFNYYWENPKNEKITEIGGTIAVPFFETKVLANYYRIDNFAYFDATPTPKQTAGSLNILQLGGETNLAYKNFHLNPRLLFQSALTNKDLLPTPNFVGRINLYYQAKAFKKAAEIQTGIKVYYFSKFASRDYLPVINEFILPNSSAYSIGGQPIMDAYFNMRVKKMFFYVEAQHFDTTFMQNKSYTAHYYPIYDFRLNIGIVWYLFS